MDRDYNIWVADARNDTVRRFTAFGREVGRLGEPHERESGAARRDRTGRLDHPHSVAVFGDSVFVACGERWLVRGVQCFLRDGTVLPHLRAFGEADGRFGAPRGIAASPAGVFVADTLHGVIQRFRLHGPYVGRVPTARTPEEVSRPVAVAPIRDGQELLVVDTGDDPGIRRFSIDGRLLPFEVPAGMELVDASALAIDEQERVYVLDRHGERVQRMRADLTFDAELIDLAEVGFGD